MAEKRSVPESNDDKKAASPTVDWHYCSRCDKTLPQDEKIEHEDWHMAQDLQAEEQNTSTPSQNPPVYAPPPGAPPGQPRVTVTTSSFVTYPSGYTAVQSAQPRAHHHRNPVSDAAEIRARDEQEMQNALQTLQMQYRIYNPEIEPEHEIDGYCPCPIHQYLRLKWSRSRVQDMWCQAVLYPGEKRYIDFNTPYGSSLWNYNPYNKQNVCSPYGYNSGWFAPTRPLPQYHERFIQQTMRLNHELNTEAQYKVDNKEPTRSIWADPSLESSMAGLDIKNHPDEKGAHKGEHKGDAKTQNPSPLPPKAEKTSKPSKMASFKKSLGIKSAAEKDAELSISLKQAILAEEAGRWPDAQWRDLITSYQEKTGIRGKVALLRNRYPIQYLHLLRAGYFEPIPVAWANLASNPLKFSIEAASGWPGITPAWRGYEDTAEERLYWVLNHRDGVKGARLKPDFISVMQMALARMASAVEPPPQYFSPNDTCHVQHTSAGYSKQVMPPPFVPHDRPETSSDDTMILLDISGSMDFDPMRPIYDRYLIMDYFRTKQPKNKDAARAIVNRFTDAMINHDHNARGYDLITFSSQAHYLGNINHRNFDNVWSGIRFGGGTRVMTGWQKVKDLHFQKHSQSAIHHPVYGWQAGPETPILRLLLLLDGEATDMDEFELDLLGLSWAHVTIFLIGVDGCPHHHRHANELQRISDVNPHVAFVDAQGNVPERFVTHELLKRHLGRDISMSEFESMEELPAYTE